MDVKVWYGMQDFGKTIIVTIHGEEKEIVIDDFNGFWNHGAVNSEIQWVNEGINGIYVGYFWTNKILLFNAVVKRCLFGILSCQSETYKKKKHGAIIDARKRAQEIIDSMKHEKVLNQNKHNVAPYRVNYNGDLDMF